MVVSARAGGNPGGGGIVCDNGVASGGRTGIVLALASCTGGVGSLAFGVEPFGIGKTFRGRFGTLNFGIAASFGWSIDMPCIPFAIASTLVALALAFPAVSISIIKP